MNVTYIHIIETASGNTGRSKMLQIYTHRNQRNLNAACEAINKAGIKAAVVPVELTYPALHIDFANGAWAEIGSGSNGMIDLDTINEALKRNHTEFQL